MSFWHDENIDNTESRIRKSSSLTDLELVAADNAIVNDVDGPTQVAESDASMGERISNILHRTFFTEQEKLLRGEPVDHPVLNSDIRRDGTSSTFTTEDDSGKRWGDYFDRVITQLEMEEFRGNVPGLGSVISTDDSEEFQVQHVYSAPVPAIKEHSAKGGSMFACTDWDTSTLSVISEDVLEHSGSRSQLSGSDNSARPTLTSRLYPPIPDESDECDGGMTSESDFGEDRDCSRKSVLISTSAKPFLGDDLSQHRGASFSSDMFHSAHGSMANLHADTVKRVSSLTAIDEHKALQSEPCLLPMPASPTRDLHGLFSCIPPHAWILPYVITGAVMLSAERKDGHRRNLSNVSLLDSNSHLASMDSRHRTPPSQPQDDIRLPPSPVKSAVPGAEVQSRRRRSRSITMPMPVPVPGSMPPATLEGPSGGLPLSLSISPPDNDAIAVMGSPPCVPTGTAMSISPPTSSQGMRHPMNFGSSFPPRGCSGESMDMDTGGGVLQARSAESGIDRFATTDRNQHNRFFSFGRRKGEDASMDDSHYRDKEKSGEVESVHGGSEAPPARRFPSLGSLRRRDEDTTQENLLQLRDNISPGMDGSSPERSSRGLFFFSHRPKDPSMDDSHFDYKQSMSPGSGSGASSPPSESLSTSPAVGLLGGLLQRMRSVDQDERREKDGEVDVSVHGDLVISHDEHGVYLTSKPDHIPASEACLPRSLRGADAPQRSAAVSSALPKFMQHLFVFPNFAKLGSVYISKTNPAWGTWEKRRAFLWDNYVFEALHDDDGIPVGFANLSGAIVQLKTDVSTSGRVGGLRLSHLDRAVRILFYASSDRLSPRVEVFLSGKSHAATDEIYGKLLAVSRMDERNLYDFDTDATPLGEGRYSTVHRAVNKSIRERARVPLSDSNPSLATAATCSPPICRGYVPPRCDDPSSDHMEEGGRSGDGHEQETVPGQCALKVIDKEEFWSQVQTNLERKDTLVREVLAQSFILSSIISCGPSETYDELSMHDMELPIVQINGVFETRSTFVIDMELMQGTDLFQKLSEHGRSFKEYQVKHIAIQLVQAVAMLEACAISHRDIKLSNITFPMKINEELASSSRQAGGKHQPMQIKLADFGMAGFVEKDGFLRGRCGTPGYVAPEIFRSGVQEGYSLNVDMYSVGVCLYTLLCGYEPFAGDSLEEIIAANKLSVYDCDTAEWEKVSDDAKDFVQRAMSATSKNRLTVLEALAHPWMAQYGGTINYPPKFKHTKNSKACVVS